jgi:tetratricopeptide (TPR) repeat protein
MRLLRTIPLAFLGASALLFPAVRAQDGQTPARDAESTARHRASVDRVWAKRYADHLPEWCKYTMELPSSAEEKGAYGDPRGAPWVAEFGQHRFMHLHHYCRGLDHLYQGARVVNEQEREFLFKEAVKECDYLLDRTDDTFVLKPEIYYKKGVALMTLGKAVEAVESFTTALRIRPDYEPAYVSLSQFFERAGDRAEARRLIEEGLRWIPQSTQLTARLAELKGRTQARR